MELRNILEALWRRRWVVTGVFVSIFLTIVVSTMLITPRYDATAKVLLRKSAASFPILSSLDLQSTSASQTAVISTTDQADYLALSTVKPVIDKVISELHIKRVRVRAKIMKALPFLKPILKALGVDVDSVEEIITAEDLLEASIISNIFPRPYVKAEQYEETDIIEIQAKSIEPKEAMDIANAVARAFVEEELKRVREDYKGAKQFIGENTEKAQCEYNKAVQALRDLKEKERFVNLDTETQNLITMISDFRKGMENNKLDILKTRDSAKKIESKLKSIPKYQKASERLKENEAISPLKLALRDLSISLAETKTKYTSDHPAVIDIQNKISETKQLLKNEMVKVFGDETTSISTVYEDLTEKLMEKYADLAGYEAQNHAYPKLIKKYESELMSLPRKNAEFSQLQLAVTVSQDVYDSLLKSSYQVGMAESVALSNIYLIESAVAPKLNDSKHKHPSFAINMIVALLLGTTLGIGVALFMDFMDDSIRTPDDIRVFKGLTFLGSIFRINRRESRLISAIDPKSPLSENFRTIRNSIKFATFENPPKSITVSSSIEAEGKSFLTSNLAISMANEGKKVLVIDGDLRRPSIHTLFNLTNTTGLTDFLVGEIELKNILMTTGIDGLTLMPSGPIPPDPARLVESQKMHQLIKDMEEIYDIVIIDTPPILAASDAVQFAGWTDGTIIVAESAKASRKLFPEVLESVKNANANIIGVVLNKVMGEGNQNYYGRYYYKKRNGRK